DTTSLDRNDQDHVCHMLNSPARLRRRRRSGAARNRLRDLLLTVVIFGLLALISVQLDRSATERHAGVPRVQDGDSLGFGAERIRLLGIDAPELGQTCHRGETQYPCGREARDALAGLVGSRPVVCTGHQRDRYSRLLAVCTAGEQNLNRRMVALGWAVAYGDFEAEEEAARQRGVGLWAGSFDRPGAWRVMHGEAIESEHAGLARIINWLRQVLHAY